MSITFDPAKKGSSLSLSNGNLTATASGFAEGVLSTDSAPAGQKLYAELTVNALSSGGVEFGLATSSVNVNALLGNSDVYAFVFQNSGIVNNNGSPFSYGGSWTASDVISMLYDVAANTVEYWVNGVSKGTAFSSSAHAGQFALGASGTPFFLAAGFNVASVGNVTVNFGATPFVYTMPAGYGGWVIPPTAGNGAAILQALTALGQRIAAGAAIMQEFSAVGGFNGYGTAVLPQLQADGSGGTKGGAAVLQSFTIAGVGHSAVAGMATLQPLQAAGTGSTGSLAVFDLSVPMTTLVANGITGGVGTASLTVPRPTPEIHFQPQADLSIPVPTLVATGVCGEVGTAALILKAPTLVSDGLCGSLLSAALTVPKPKLVADGLSESIGTIALILRAPYLTASGTSGQVGSAALSIPMPTLAFVGYGPFTGSAALTFATPFYLNARGVSELAAALRTWVLNLRKKGLTEYTGFSFNSYTDMGNEVLGANDSGLFRLTKTADDDAGIAIDAVVRTGKETFGTTFNKRVPRIYAGYASAGSLNFITITSKDGRRVYLLPDNGMANVQQRRVPVGRGPKSPYWQFEVANIAGCDFQLENLQVYPEKTHRRVI